MAVTPEGSVCFWPDIGHASHCIETTLDVTGEACMRLVTVDSDARVCVLATGNSTLFSISVTHGPGGLSLSGRMIRAADAGFLRGMSRRVSTFIWGSQPMRSGIGADLRSAVAVGKTVYLLGGNKLQKWTVGVSIDADDQLHCELDLAKMIGDCLAETFWGQDAANMPGIRVWLIDMVATKNGVMVLAGGTDVAANATVHYIVVTLNPEAGIEPSISAFSSFLVTSLTSTFNEECVDNILGYQITLPDPTSHLVYLHNGKEVVCISIYTPTQPVDKVDFESSGDRLLGSGFHLRTFLVFSAVNGLLAVTPIRSMCLAPGLDAHSSLLMDTDAMSITGAMTEMSGLDLADTSIINTSISTDDMVASSDRGVRLKAAFALCCKHELSQAQSIVESLFPLPNGGGPEPALDAAILSLSQELIDDFPASDPRWAESRPFDGVLTMSGPGMATASLLLLYQLEDKQKVHNLLLGFLKSVGLWNRLSMINVNSRQVSTRHLLCEHAEKLIATMALRQHHQSFPVLIDAVVAKVLEQKRRVVAPMPHLTNQDLFYREVSKVEDFLYTLVEHVEAMVSAETDADEVVSLLSSTNTVVYSMMSSAVTYRTSNGILYAPSQGDEDPAVEVKPWTTSGGSKGLRTLLINQHKATVASGIALTKDPQLKTALVHQLVEMADLILSEYSNQLECLENSIAMGGVQKNDRLIQIKEEYINVRKKLIAPLLDLEFYEKASSLAEKYADFETLVLVCEKSDSEQRLHRYINEFASRGFSDFLYQYYLNKGQKGKLLQQPAAYHNHVNRFLNEHSDLSWLHDIRTNSFAKASNTLRNLAMQEQDYFGRKKSMLSIAKLCALASDEPQQIVNDKVELIADEQAKMLHQETLPQCILDHLGESTATMRVMPPEELISLYVSEFNEEASEADFKKALDLVIHMQQDGADAEQLTNPRLLIWRQALLRDDWTSLSVDDPLESFKTTMFSRLLESLMADGENLKEIVPPIQALSQQEDVAALINENKAVEFILRAGYEHVQRVVASQC